MKKLNSKIGLWRGFGWLLFAGLIGLTGCTKPPVEVVSVELVTNMDRGSGNFNRVLKICFSEPTRSDYYHTIQLETQESYKLKGGSWLRPLSSDPKNPCHLRNVYLYLGKDDPPGSRPMIDEYVRPGNIKQLILTIYPEDPNKGQVEPMFQKTFSNL